MMSKKIKHKKGLVGKVVLHIFSMFPASVCMVGFYGMFMASVEQPEAYHHQIALVIAFVPSLFIYIILVRIETKRRNRLQERVDEHRRLKNYKKLKHFNNGDALLSESNGQKDFLHDRYLQLLAEEKAKLEMQAKQTVETETKPITMPESPEIPKGRKFAPGAWVGMVLNEAEPFRKEIDQNAINETLSKLQNAKDALAKK